MAQRATRDRLSISQVSALLGIPVPTIRSWERRYGFPSPARTEGKHRRYAPEDVERLRGLRDEITKGHPVRRAVELVRSGRREVARGEFLERFGETARALDIEGVRRSLDQAVEVIGVERAIVEVAMLGMRELGDLWQSGTCDIATEHAATGAVRQWLARLSAATPPPLRPRPLVLATGPTELHTMGLEAFAVLLSRRGWSIRMLGALTPPEALVAAVGSSRAAGAIVTAQRSVGRRGAIESLRGAERIASHGLFYAGNAFSTRRSHEGVPGTYLGTDLVAAAELVGSMIG